jgi:signal transduction histidine kinase/DNA-binding response OmpR family regulator
LTNIHPEDRDRIAADIGALFNRGQMSYEFQYMNGDGSYRWIRCELRLIRNETGKAVEAVGALLDITERKRAEEAERKLQMQLQQAQKLESIGRLAGGVAHDFNNLLCIVNGYADLVLHELSPENPLHEAVSEIRMAGERAASLSRQLLVLSRNQVVKPTDLNLNELIAEVERMLGRVIGEDIRLKSVLNPSLGRVLADPGQLHQVLMNLAVNARDAMPEGGALLIETDNVELSQAYADQHAEIKPGSYVQLKVSDTGVGMTREVISRLFEPFFTTKQPGEGTGLGLATVYSIVKQLGGAISVYSELGQGTTFTIYLPRLVHWTATVPEVSASPALRGAETILLVEDDQQLRKMSAFVLRGYGYTVLEAADMNEAIMEFERSSDPIDLLLTDLVMPGGTGRELANRIKAARPSTRVLFVSGYSASSMTDRGLLDSTTSYLQKPFSPEILATRVRETLGLPNPSGTVLIVDDDPGSRYSLCKLLISAGYKVLEARDRAEAIEQLRFSAIDLVILNVGMSPQEALATVRALRQQKAGLRVVAISDQSGEYEDVMEQIQANASLKRPIQPDELLVIVRRWLTAEGGESPNLVK